MMADLSTGSCGLTSIFRQSVNSYVRDNVFKVQFALLSIFKSKYMQRKTAKDIFDQAVLLSAVRNAIHATNILRLQLSLLMRSGIGFPRIRLDVC